MTNQTMIKLGFMFKNSLNQKLRNSLTWKAGF
jgi:hypothetical protein